MSDEWRETGGTTSAHVSFGTLGGDDPISSPHQPTMGSHIREHSEAQCDLAEGVWVLCDLEDTPQSPCALSGYNEAELRGTGPPESPLVKVRLSLSRGDWERHSENCVVPTGTTVG